MKINISKILGATLAFGLLASFVSAAVKSIKVEDSLVIKGVRAGDTIRKSDAVNHVYLFNGDKISGTVISLNKNALFLYCLLSKALRIDMRAVMAVDFQSETRNTLHPRKGEMDKIEFINGDKVTGDVLSLSEKIINIRGEYGELTFKKEGLSHIIFGLREKIDLGFPREEKSVATLKLVNGDVLSGKLLNFKDDTFYFTVKYSQELQIKSQYVSALTFTPLSVDYYFKLCTNYEYIPDSNFKANPGIKKLEAKHIKDWYYFHVSANAVDWKTFIDNFQIQSHKTAYGAYIVDVNEWNNISTSPDLSQ